MREFRVFGKREVIHLASLLPEAAPHVSWLQGTNPLNAIPIIEDATVQPGVLKVVNRDGAVVKEITLFRYEIDYDALQRAAEEASSQALKEMAYAPPVSDPLKHPLWTAFGLGRSGTDRGAFSVAHLAT